MSYRIFFVLSKYRLRYQNSGFENLSDFFNANFYFSGPFEGIFKAVFSLGHRLKGSSRNLDIYRIIKPDQVHKTKSDGSHWPVFVKPTCYDTDSERISMFHRSPVYFLESPTILLQMHKRTTKNMVRNRTFPTFSIFHNPLIRCLQDFSTISPVYECILGRIHPVWHL